MKKPVWAQVAEIGMEEGVQWIRARRQLDGIPDSKEILGLKQIALHLLIRDRVSGWVWKDFGLPDEVLQRCVEERQLRLNEHEYLKGWLLAVVGAGFMEWDVVCAARRRATARNRIKP